MAYGTCHCLFIGLDKCMDDRCGMELEEEE